MVFQAGQKIGHAFLELPASEQSVHRDTDRAAVVTRTSLNLVRLAAVLSWSLIPSLAERCLAVFSPECDGIPTWPGAPLQSYLDQGGGETIADIGPLVEKISEAKLCALRNRFGDGR